MSQFFSCHGLGILEIFPTDIISTVLYKFNPEALQNPLDKSKKSPHHARVNALEETTVIFKPKFFVRDLGSR